jgi:type I restriction enzyme M protein
MNYVWQKFRAGSRAVRDLDLIKYAHSYIRGIDFNPDLAKVGKMHMVLYDDGHSGIFSADALEDWDILKKAAADAGVTGIERDGFDVVLTNPPFGSKGKVTSKRLLQSFSLGHRWKQDKKAGEYTQTIDVLSGGQVPDVLFLERCLEILRVGGRAAIVIPNSDLNNLSLQHVRQYLMARSRILAVVSLPVGTFTSAGSNPQPSILFLQKLTEEDAATLNAIGYPIFMAEVRKLGYDLARKTAPTIYKKDSKGNVLKDGNGAPIIDTDIPEVIEMFQKFRASHALSFGGD